MEVKERITWLRKERGWSLSKLAKEACISENAVYNWYNDKNYTPSRDAVEDVCGALKYLSRNSTETLISTVWRIVRLNC